MKNNYYNVDYDKKLMFPHVFLLSAIVSYKFT